VKGKGYTSGLVGLVPQANSAARADRFLCLAARPGATIKEVANQLSMTRRQGQYYRDLGVMLGYIEAGPSRLVLTVSGLQYVQSDEDGRAVLLKTSIGNLAVVRWLRSVIWESPEKRVTDYELRKRLATEARLSLVTAGRRLSSLKALVRYSGQVASQVRPSSNGWWTCAS
jgi:hypothetical protein